MRLLLILFTALLVLAPRVARAQDVPSGPLTLEQVLELAEARSETVAVARAGITVADADARRARSGLFPQVTALVSFDRALASEFEGVFEGLDVGGAGEADPPPGAGEEGGFEDLPFGRENTWRASLSLSQSLWSGGRIGAQQALAAAGHDAAALGLTTARAQLLFEVTQAYYDAALSDRLVAIAEATLEQATATLDQAQVAFQAGAQPEFEVLRARVSRDTQQPALIRQRMNRELALLRLKQLLDLPADADLRLADTLGSDVLAPPPAFAPRVAAIEAALVAGTAGPAPAPPVADADRAAVQEVATTVRLREAALDAVEAERWPSVSLTSNYGRVAYPSNVLTPTFDRLNWTVGVSMQVPLLTGGRQRADEAAAAAQVEQAQLRLRQMEELAALDTRSALAELVASRAAWEATAGTIQQARRAYELADIRYDAGVSTQLELSDARLLLQQAEANQAQAARNLQVARARVALLPGLPIGAGGGTAPASGPAPAAPATPATQAGGQIRNASAQPGAQFGAQP